MDKKHLKIAMVGHKRMPSREGGIEVVVEELSVRMVQLGNHVTCYNRSGKHIAGKDNNELESMKEYKGVSISHVPTIDVKGLAALTSSFFATLKAIASKPDVIHYHAEGPSVMLLLPHILGIRTVATIHGLDWQRSKWGGFASAYLKLGEKIAAKYADEVIVLSRSVQRYFSIIYDRDTRYIHNGVNTPIVLAADSITKKWGLYKDEYLLFLGRIVPEKGVVNLINAFKKVNTLKKLVIAGSPSDTGDYMEEVLEAAKNDSRIFFTGFVEGQELVELYSNAYVYTLPSDLEGMPLSLLEAMSYNNCCLVSDIPECTEVVGSKAMTFKVGNLDDLRDKLQYLCDRPQLIEKYRQHAGDYICEKYSWDDVVLKTLALYRGADIDF